MILLKLWDIFIPDSEIWTCWVIDEVPPDILGGKMTSIKEISKNQPRKCHTIFNQRDVKMEYNMCKPNFGGRYIFK